MSDPVGTAKQTLLRALDQIDDAELRTGGTVTYLAVVYSVTVPPPDGESHGSTIRGWSTTDDPPWLTAALLRDMAENIEAGRFAFEPDEGPE